MARSYERRPSSNSSTCCDRTEDRALHRCDEGGVHAISNALEEHDPELDLEGRKAPKWAHHSSRRKSDKVARETMDDTGATKDDIDDMYGWKQAERAKDMQLHYEGRRLRSRHARISMMV